MVKLIIGTAGTGKTSFVYDRIKQCLEENKKVLFFVPDQFSFDTQRRIYKSVNRERIFNVRVTSFSKLSEEILSKYGEAKPYADDIVKDIKMRAAIQAKRDSLLFYNKQAQKSEFSSFMINTVSDMKNGGVTPEKLKKLLESENDFSTALVNKLHDISIIFEEYNHALTSIYHDRMDDVSRAAELAEQEDFFENYTVFFDDFDVFSGNQLTFIQTIIRSCPELYFTINADGENAENAEGNKYFAGSYSLINRLKQYADNDGVEIKTTLLKTLHRQQTRLAPEVISAENIYKECDFIAAKIHSLAFDEEIRYKKILVLNNTDSYDFPLAASFAKYDIPMYYDKPVKLIEKPLARFFVLVLQALDFEPQHIFDCIKSGFFQVAAVESDGNDGNEKASVPLDSKEIYTLEQLQIEWGLTKEDWQKPLPNMPYFDEAEPIRNKIMTPLQTLKKRIENTTGDVITKHLSSFMTDVMSIGDHIITEKTKSGTNQYNEIVNLINGGKEAGSGNLSLWSKIIGVLESMYTGLSGVPLTIKEYCDYLRNVLSTETIAKPPQFLDAVTVGNLRRTRMYEPSVVIICGFNEGIIPAQIGVKGAFTSTETELLCDCGINIEDNCSERYSKQYFYAYKAYNSAKIRTIITYPLQGLFTDDLTPSPLIDSLTENVSRQKANEYPIEFYASTEKSLFYNAAEKYGKQAPESAALQKAIENINADENYGERLKFARDINSKYAYLHSIDPQDALILLKTRSFSPTRIERLNNCKYSYYLQYGLRLFSPQDSSPTDSREIGNVVHSVMNTVLKKYYGRSSEKAFAALTLSELESEVKSAASDYNSNHFPKGFGCRRYAEQEISRIIPRITTMLSVLQIELGLTKFVPKRFEENVTYSITDSSNTVRKISGKLDRLDVFEEDGFNYLRVCDYKTGHKTMIVAELEKGLGLQPLLYAAAVAKENDKNKIGAFCYISAQGGDDYKAPSSPEERETTFNLEKMTVDNNTLLKNWLSGHKPSGIVLEEVAQKQYEIIKSYFSTRLGSRADFYPLTMKNESLITELLTGGEEIIAANIVATENGNIEAVPIVKNEKESSCMYCAFGHLCNNKDGILKHEQLAEKVVKTDKEGESNE